ETVKKFIALGCTVAIEAGAGLPSGIPDADYAAAGAEITPDVATTLAGAGVVLKIRAPLGTGEGPVDELSLIPRGALMLGQLQATPEMAATYAQLGIEAGAMELLPRITRAQSMDILSSQANLSGYRAVIEAAGAFDRGFPMLMTAAGTISAANVFVMGAGVAGLQAIATARRLGGRVSATDVRPAAKEEIKSLGAAYVGYESEESKQAQTAGGYAKQLSAEFYAEQAKVVAAHIAKQDIVITTALIPGRPAPRLISDAQLATMRAGSVVVDLAAEAGGNVEGTVAGERTVKHGVTIIGASNLARSLAADSSALFARNLYNFLSAFWDKEQRKPVLPDDDEIVIGIRLTHGGKVVHERLTAA
ncbi:MAG: NAD(P) transhydrogenase subunit alpha, partial [Sphingomicrobium sp.]